MQESYSSVPVCSKGLLISLDIFSDLNYLLTLNIYFFFLFYIYRVISYNFDILETFFFNMDSYYAVPTSVLFSFNMCMT